jgi:hypothetical protein
VVVPDVQGILNFISKSHYVLLFVELRSVENFGHSPQCPRASCADMEFNGLVGELYHHDCTNVSMLDFVDWRNKGIMVSVKSQRSQCIHLLGLLEHGNG